MMQARCMWRKKAKAAESLHWWCQCEGDPHFDIGWRLGGGWCRGRQNAKVARGFCTWHRHGVHKSFRLVEDLRRGWCHAKEARNLFGDDMSHFGSKYWLCLHGPHLRWDYFFNNFKIFVDINMICYLYFIFYIVVLGLVYYIKKIIE